ncbi:hypothetical protein EYF80_006716 [Liparis tanakae]|uniref:Uncharacterized protein n=1 Tax=Liparis tanakae TaxID=230148 RepID=A0A4Z2IYP7_9TELE|nr:hypothetical protein EYF80_006716 [Liparis tanakae]
MHWAVDNRCGSDEASQLYDGVKLPERPADIEDSCCLIGDNAHTPMGRIHSLNFALEYLKIRHNMKKADASKHSAGSVIQPGYPHQLPLTPHHSPAAACHVLGVKGFPPIAHQNGSPPSPAPRTKSQSIGGQTEMDWDIHDPVPLSQPPARPPKGGCHRQIIEAAAVHWRAELQDHGQQPTSTHSELESSYNAVNINSGNNTGIQK